MGMEARDREQAARQALNVALRTAFLILGSREEASEVAQDVAIDVVRSLHRLRDPDAFDAWVYRITVRHTMRAIRKRNARLIEIPLESAVDATEVALLGVDRDLVIAARGALHQALATLPPRQRVALVLRYVQDLSDVQIAAALGCRRGTANALLSRGRAALREIPALKDIAAHMEGTYS
jgi:RNA polymerase sigma factor (sigma-70 family)